MEFNIGDKVIYSFPEATSSGITDFSGYIESVSENFIVIRNRKDIQLKVSFKNFDFIKPLKNSNRTAHTENYIG